MRIADVYHAIAVVIDEDTDQMCTNTEGLETNGAQTPSGRRAEWGNCWTIEGQPDSRHFRVCDIEGTFRVVKSTFSSREKRYLC